MLEKNETQLLSSLKNRAEQKYITLSYRPINVKKWPDNFSDELKQYQNINTNVDEVKRFNNPFYRTSHCK